MASRLLLVALAAAAATSSLTTARAQGLGRAKQIPNELYFLAQTPYLEGEFQTAAKAFREAAKGGYASTEGRWIDSICFHAMLGECFYQMGENPAAREQFEAAIKLLLVHRDWMLRVEFPDTLGPKQGDSTTITWGTSKRSFTIGHFQDRYQSLQGRLDGDAVIRQGGVVAPPTLHPVYVTEIIRCSCLAISRRRELMGPACEHDPLTAELVNALARRPGKPNHWSQCFVELQLGLAYASANKIPQAASELQKSAIAAGVYDHPLTCVALLELARLAFEQGKYDAAMQSAHEATISAAYFDRFEVMEEAFRLGALAHIVSGQKGIYSPLAPAAVWTRKMGFVHASILTALADNAVNVGDLAAATAAVADATKAMNRTDMPRSLVGARLNYQNARLNLQSGNLRPGGAALTAAMGLQKAASKRLFQIGLVDLLYTRGEVTERVADMLYSEVLREPTRVDWSVDPLETLTVSVAPHPLPYEHWFELALKRKEQDKALNIADRIRRHRFYATQALGGRVLALRWVLEAPKESLSPEAVLQRQDLLVKYPRYAELAGQAEAIEKELAGLPLAPTEEADKKQQLLLLAELAKVSAAQEIMLNLMSLERLPAEFAFPPLVETKDLQRRIPDGTLIFIYLTTTSNVHAFALTKDRYGHFVVAQPAKVKADVAELLRGIGQLDRTQPVGGDDLLKDDWKLPAGRLLKQLTNDTKPEDWSKYKELVIVPDGVLWYLPFEILQIPAGGGSEPLFDKLPIRYAPTLALTLPDGRPIKRVSRTAVALGKLYPREDDALTQLAAEQLGGLADVTTFSDHLPAPSGVLAAAYHRFVLMADVEDPDKLPYGWSPAKLDAGKPGSTLADWTLLPFAGAEQVVFPGFHTAAEFGLKRPGTGDELFLTVCGLMASGSRTVVLSRWRVGGQSTVELMRELVQELPHTSASAAWRRSVQLAADRVVDPSAEPRLKPPAADGLKADHPFFWSGYLLVDTGAAPPAEEKKE
jgi:hypothetical protein